MQLLQVTYFCEGIVTYVGNIITCADKGKKPPRVSWQDGLPPGALRWGAAASGGVGAPARNGVTCAPAAGAVWLGLDRSGALLWLL